MTDTFFEKFMRCAKACGLFFLMLILDADWLGKLQSHDRFQKLSDNTVSLQLHQQLKQIYENTPK